MNDRTILRPAWLLCAAALLALVAAPAVRAGDDGDFKLHLDSLVFGPQYVDVDTDSAKFNEYRDITDGFKVPKVAISGDDEAGLRQMSVLLRNVGQRDARYTLDYDVSGRYSFLFDYNKIPHNFQNGATFLWQETSPGVFQIANPVQQAIQNAILSIPQSQVNFTFLNNLIEPYLAAAQRIDVGLQRDRSHAAMEFGKGGAWSWGLDYKHENRTGSRPVGAAFGFNNVNELPEPIDYDTDDAELGAQWKTKRGALRFGYRYSTFENHVDTLYWDNPFRYTNSTDPSAYQAPSSSSVNGSTIGYMTLNPDNESDSLFANGNWRFGKAMWFNFSASMTNFSQDESLHPMTLNTAVTPTIALPQGTAGREAEVTTLNADFGTRFADAFTFKLRYRFYDYDNKSDHLVFDAYVRYHGVYEDIGRETPDYAYSRDTLSADLGWEIGKDHRLGLEYRMDGMDRDFREVESADDDVLRFTYDGRFSSTMSLRATAELGDRSTSEYDYFAEEYSFTEHGVPSQNPELRRYDEAERDYERFNAMFQWNPTEAWSFAFSFDTRQDDYSKSELGLTEEEYFNYNLEASYMVSEKASFYGFYQRSDRDSSMVSRQSGASASLRDLDNWYADFEEANDLFGLGFYTKGERFSFDLSGRWSQSDGYLDFEAFPGGLPLGSRPAAVDIPNYEDIELLALYAKLDYTIMKNVKAGVYYRYEDYTIDSFIVQDLDDYLPGALLLAGDRGDYTANVMGLLFKVSF